jgi:carbon storage regulator
MLVLTRKLMEKLFIGDDICVTVVRLEGGQVRLGIDAPREVSVVRAELVPERLVPRPRTPGHGSSTGSHSGSSSSSDTSSGSGSGSSTNPGAGARRSAPPPMHSQGDLRSQPPLVAHGIDSRRRGRSR